MTDRFDAIVIGSGFGGAVTACRLAEAGYRVLVLERGRRWRSDEFPRISATRGAGTMPTRSASTAGSTSGSSATWRSPRERPSVAARTSTPTSASRRHRHLRVRLAAGGHLPGTGTALRSGRRDDERPAGPARAVAGADRPDARSGHEDRIRGPLPTARPGGELRSGLGPGSARCPRPRSFAALHQRRRDRAGDLHPPRGVRHRLPGTRPQHPRHELHPARRAARRRGPAAAHRPARSNERAMATAFAPTGSRTAASCRSRKRPGSWWWPRGRSAPRSSCSAAATSRRRCPTCRRPSGSGWSSNGDFLTIGLHKGRRVDPTRGPTITSAIDFRDGSVDGQLVHRRGRRVPRRRRSVDVACVDPLELAAPRADPLQRVPEGGPGVGPVRVGHALVRAGPGRRRRPARAPSPLVGPVRTTPPVARLGRDRLAPDDRGDHRDAPPACGGDRRDADRAVELVVARIPDHAAPARRLQHGNGPVDERRRPPRPGVGPPRTCTSWTARSSPRRSARTRHGRSQRWPSAAPRSSSGRAADERSARRRALRPAAPGRPVAR